tara:strand:+ start:335 stop:829 length:495 start_codon:yes stop_codon:yes gene_type:complete
MHEVSITEGDLDKAKNRYDFSNLNNSITEGSSQLYGAVGEVIVINHYNKNHNVVDKSSYNYDLIINDKTIEVKTKKTKFAPKDDYVVSVACSNATQECDYYYFTMVHDDFSRGWLLGFMSRDDFFEKSILCRKGEIDPLNKNNNFIVKADCYSLRISDITNRIK